MSTTKPRAGLALIIAALTAGCRSDSSTGPKSNTLDLGAVFSQMLISDVNAFPDFSELIQWSLNLVPPAIDPSACSYSASSGGFTCPPTTVASPTLFADFALQVSYFLYDAAGRAQSAPDANTTASVRLVIDVTGNVPLSGPAVGTWVVTDHEDMMLTGLLTPTRILHGTGTTHHDIKTTGTVEVYTSDEVVDMETKTATVVLKAPGTAGPAGPTSGTITSDIALTITTNGSTSLSPDMHEVITFDGSGLATFVQTPGATCTIDLSGKTMTRCR